MAPVMSMMALGNKTRQRSNVWLHSPSFTPSTSWLCTFIFSYFGVRVSGERFSHQFEMLKSNRVKIKSMKLDITAIISKSRTIKEEIKVLNSLAHSCYWSHETDELMQRKSLEGSKTNTIEEVVQAKETEAACPTDRRKTSEMVSEMPRVENISGS